MAQSLRMPLSFHAYPSPLGKMIPCDSSGCEYEATWWEATNCLWCCDACLEAVLQYHYKKVEMTFPNETRLEVTCELIEENELPVYEVKDYYSKGEAQPALSFFFYDEDMTRVREFMLHAQTINLASTYRIMKYPFAQREG